MATTPATLRQAQEINGKKRHVLVDPQTLRRHAIVHAADSEVGDGGVRPMRTLFGLSLFRRELSADGGSQGARFQPGLKRVRRPINGAIVKRPDAAKGFAVWPKRWIVEPTIAWRNRCRGLGKEWAGLNRGARCVHRRASLRLIVRKLCPQSK